MSYTHYLCLLPDIFILTKLDPLTDLKAVIPCLPLSPASNKTLICFYFNYLKILNLPVLNILYKWNQYNI